MSSVRVSAGSTRRRTAGRTVVRHLSRAARTRRPVAGGGRGAVQPDRTSQPATVTFGPLMCPTGTDRWIRQQCPPLRSARDDRRLRGGDARDRHAERRAADVVQAGAMEERDRPRVASVLAADPDMQPRPTSPARARRRSPTSSPSPSSSIDSNGETSTILSADVRRQDAPLDVVAREARGRSASGRWCRRRRTRRAARSGRRPGRRAAARSSCRCGSPSPSSSPISSAIRTIMARISSSSRS